METVKFDYSKALSFFGEHEIEYMKDYVCVAHNMIENKNLTIVDKLFDIVGEENIEFK